MHGSLFSLAPPIPLEGSRLWVFSKTNLYAGGTNPPTVFDYLQPTNGGAIIPAMTYDNTLSTLYLLQNAYGPGGYLRLFSVTGAVGSEVFNHVEASNAVYIRKADATWADVFDDDDQLPQTNTAHKVDVKDARLNNVVYRNGCLWTVQHVHLPATNPTHTAIQWWQVNPTNTSILQMGRIEDISGAKFYVYPSIAVNKFNDVLLGYSTFSPAQYPNANYSFRAFYDTPINAMRQEYLLKAGDAIYVGSRWGDYTYSQVDPVNDADFWTIQEYCTTNSLGTGATWWGQVAVPLPTNDLFSAALALSGASGAVTNTNRRASKETGEPNHAGDSGGASVWFSWTAPSGGLVGFDTIGSAIDPLLAVYTGSSVSNLTLITNNNFGGALSVQVIFEATSNTTYQVALDGLQGRSGMLVLNWYQTLAPFFLTHPKGTNVVANVEENAVFSASALGIPPPSYQWYNGTNETSVTNLVAGATGSSYTITNVQESDFVHYQAVAINTSGSATSQVATLFIHPDSAARMTLWEAAATEFRVHIYGLTNRSYAVLSASNLNDPISWTPVFTNQVSFWYTNSSITQDWQRFFLVVTNP